jgi:hypothetical protein
LLAKPTRSLEERVLLQAIHMHGTLDLREGIPQGVDLILSTA